MTTPRTTPRLDTPRLDTARPSTQRLDTARLDTARPSTQRLDTQRLDTPRPSATDDGLADALDTLAAAAGQICDDARSRAVLAVVVDRLEDAAGAWLGDTGSDPLVVLQRRFGRAHALLAQHRAAPVGVDLLRGLALALQPADVPPPQPSARPASAAVLAGC